AVAFDCPLSTPDPPGCAPTWRTPLGDTPVAPALAGGGAVAYLDVGGTVHVLDVATGAVRFRAEVGSPVSLAPAVAGDTILVATDSGRLAALPVDGCGRPRCRPLWSASIGAAPAAPPVAGAEVAFVAREGGGIAAFDLDGCDSGRCSALTVLPTAAEVTGGPILEPGRLVAGLADGSVAAYGL
ncbi:MAG: PQQ-binding-like beta-propeller repeat protein, partial [Acidimicrobiales bacterium]|nr:PQQ-binding-like beta-propeller repeat protein [Acidimicrobiales bacterium]